VISSEKEVIELCRDKKASYDHCVEKAIPCVPTYTVSEFRDSDLLPPVFVKPRFGAGSVKNFIANSREFVGAVDANYEDEFVVQPYLEGAQYAAEMYVDLLDGDLIEYRVLKKLRMRGGESEKTIVVNSPCFEKLIRKICDSFQLKGVIDIDFIERDGEILVLEVNPRFGGVYPVVHENGGNFIKYLANNLEGKGNEISNFDYRVGNRNYAYTQLMVKEGN
jgi:carbamoyl-phosphate synthase large subunit